MTLHNRRAHTRFELNLSAEVRLGERRFTATTRDISEGGACLQSAYPLAEGENVQLALFVVVDGIEDAGTPPLVTLARVQWTADNEDAEPASRHMAGIRFDAMSDAQRAWLANVIERAGRAE